MRITQKETDFGKTMQTEKLPLCQRVYDILTLQHTWKIIEVVPALGGEQAVTGIETYEDGQTLVVGMTKKTYLAIFVEAHHFWHAEISPRRRIGYLESLDPEKLWEVYLVTVGYLLTTNENHTIVELHYEVLMLLVQIKDGNGNKQNGNQGVLVAEFEFISGLINSRLKRINKSSSLWFLMKKLTIMFIQQDPKLYDLLVERAFKSLELHFANYYAANFIKWLIRYNILTGKDNSSIRHHLQAHCRAKLTDVSIWTTLEVYLTASLGLEPDILQYTAEESAVRNPVTSSTGIQDQQKFVEEQIQWLLAAECSVITPYRCLITPLIRQKSDLTHIKQAIEPFLNKKKAQLQFLDSDDDSYPISKRFHEDLTHLVV